MYPCYKADHNYSQHWKGQRWSEIREEESACVSTPQESEVRATHTRSISSKHRRFNWEMIPYMTFSITFMPGNKKKLLII